jgi:deoxyadenosine/deoxycytidine kinase
MAAYDSAAQPPRLVVVEGPIGVGKTSLVRRLADSLGCASLLEDPDDNPFLERFYQDPRGAAFATQLHFLFQRSRQLEGLRQGDLFASRGLVADFLFAKDRLFAELTLDKHELALYDQVYSRLSMEAPRPDLVVYLQAPVSVLMQRIRRRDRRAEQTLDPDYLQRLADAYTEFFYHYDQSPLLIVNAAEINPVDNDADYRLLLERIRRAGPGKQYFNPAPLDLA